MLFNHFMKHLVNNKKYKNHGPAINKKKSMTGDKLVLDQTRVTETATIADKDDVVMEVLAYTQYIGLGVLLF